MEPGCLPFIPLTFQPGSIMSSPWSARSEATTRRTYNRPLDVDGSQFETWEHTARRAHYDHHRRLWEDVGGQVNEAELQELLQYGLDRSALVAGRTLWLGGTPYAYSRAASQFNCAGLEIATVYDMVDAFWLLLNGCGVGGIPRAGTLHGYHSPIRELKIIPSERDKDYRGHEKNIETKPTEDNDRTWTIKVGDAAESWAKVLGKMLISPRCKINRLVIDFSDVRGKGGRLKGYGWICNGYEPLAFALNAVHEILNKCAGNLLTEEDMSDVFNWCGTVLSSRRAAEALELDAHHPHANEFARRKHEYWLTPGQPRRQSNNSLLFWTKPSIKHLIDLLMMNLRGGEPGFVNALAALLKCPWFRVFNPCFEICLPSHGFCNLVSLCLPMFGRDFRRMERAIWTMARANYRQTCVNLQDGMLQSRWHQTNEALRLCGVSLTGIVHADWLTDYHIRRLRNSAVAGAYSMADELGMPRPKAITTIKPEGTRSKISGRLGMEVAEGIHKPLGRYIFNWINFANADPLVGALEAAGYKVIPNPSDNANVLVRFPVDYSGIQFDKVGGKEINLESAISQLERYRKWNTLYADHNVSSTISMDESEVPEVAEWIHRHWDDGYVATAFMPRMDMTKTTAAEYGHPYLPQEVVDVGEFNRVMEGLRPVDWDRFHTGIYDITETGNCKDGVCAVK